MNSNSKEELVAMRDMLIYCDQYEKTGDPENLYKAKAIADNWWGNDSNEGKQKVLKLVREYEKEQEQSM